MTDRKDRFGRIEELARRLPRPGPRPGFAERTARAAFTAPDRAPTRLRPLRAAAAAALLLVAGGLVWRAGRPEVDATAGGPIAARAAAAAATGRNPVGDWIEGIDRAESRLREAVDPDRIVGGWLGGIASLDPVRPVRRGFVTAARFPERMLDASDGEGTPAARKLLPF